MLLHAPLLLVLIPGSRTRSRVKLAPFTSKDKNPLANLSMVKEIILFLLIRTTQLVPTQRASTNWLWDIQVSDQIAVGQCMLKMNVILQSNLFNTESKGTEPIVRFTEVSVNYRGRECIFFLAFLGVKRTGGRERGGRPIDLIISIPYWDVTQYLGEIFCSVFQVFPSFLRFLRFETQKNLHVSPLLYYTYVCTRWDTQKKIKSVCSKSKTLTQFTSLWWGSKKLAQTVFSLLFFLTSHETLLYHWATCKEHNTKAQLMFCQPFIVLKWMLRTC